MTAGTSFTRIAPVDRGFTLIELLVTLVILVLLVTIGVPSFSETIRNNRVTAHSNELLASLLYARSEAVRTNDNITVVLDEPVGNGWQASVCINPDCDNDDDPLRQLDYTGAPISIFLSGPAPSAGLPLLTITFDRMGRSTLDPAGNVLFLEHDNCTAMQRRRVAISATGRVELTQEPCGT